MTAHTQEPWYQAPNLLVIGHLHQAEPRDTLQVVMQASICRGHTEAGSVHGSPLEAIGYDEAVANTARAIVCVNGCEGINPKAVPELLVAAERALIGDDPKHPDWYEGMLGDAIDEIRAAIALARNVI
jgi:hypothetical protein